MVEAVMQHRVLAAVAAIALGSLAAQRASAQVMICANPNNCIQVSVGDTTGAPNGTVTVPVTFKQGPANAQAGGPDEIAALALTLSLAPDAGGTPLTLADCTAGADGLPAAVHPDASISGFKVVVENAFCTGGLTHCLCPDPGGVAPDNFLNLVVYGPNPLPTPGPNPIDIPVLPAGPQQLLTIDLKIAASATGTIPLRIFNEVTHATKPQFTAYLSVGDKTAVDQTCVPVTGQPPCSAPQSQSQVSLRDGTVMVKIGCAGDCNGDGEVTVDELLTMVNIALALAPVSQCPPGDVSMDGEITIDEILTAVNIALSRCPA